MYSKKEISLLLEAVNCFEKATTAIEVTAGNHRTISLSLCNICLTNKYCQRKNLNQLLQLANPLTQMNTNTSHMKCYRKSSKRFTQLRHEHLN